MASAIGAPRPHATSAVAGDVLQIDPAHDPIFGGAFLVVTEVKSWGVQGYVTIPGGGVAYYRVAWPHVVYIGGTEWAQPSALGEDDDA